MPANPGSATLIACSGATNPSSSAMFHATVGAAEISAATAAAAVAAAAATAGAAGAGVDDADGADDANGDGAEAVALLLDDCVIGAVVADTTGGEARGNAEISAAGVTGMCRHVCRKYSHKI